jgi:hypothetical protein
MNLNTQRWPAWAPLLGIVFVVLAVLAGLISGETPDIKDSPQKILDFYNDNDSSQQIAGALLTWGCVAFLFFLGVLRSTLRVAEEGPARLSAVAFAGGIVLAIGMLAFAGFTFTLGDAADHLTPDAAQALNALNSDFFLPLAAGGGTLMLATGICIVRTRALPAWLGWLAVVIGIVAITPAGFFGFLAFLVWTIIVSIVLWRAGTGAAAAAPPSAV